MLTRPLAIPPRAEVTTEIEVLAPPGATLGAALSLFSQSTTFRLKGTLWIDPIGGVSRLPIDVQTDSSVFAN